MSRPYDNKSYYCIALPVHVCKCSAKAAAEQQLAKQDKVILGARVARSASVSPLWSNWSRASSVCRSNIFFFVCLCVYVPLSPSIRLAILFFLCSLLYLVVVLLFIPLVPSLNLPLCNSLVTDTHLAQLSWQLKTRSFSSFPHFWCSGSQLLQCSFQDVPKLASFLFFAQISHASLAASFLHLLLLLFLRLLGQLQSYTLQVFRSLTDDRIRMELFAVLSLHSLSLSACKKTSQSFSSGLSSLTQLDDSAN